MNPVTAAAIQAFLAATVPAFEAKEARLRGGTARVVEPKDLDITSHGNTVATYQDAESQLIYANMYLAKHVGCWRWLRSRLAYDAAVPVVSVGAGPHLCLWGWFFDRPPVAGQKVQAVDALPWDAVLGRGEHAAVTAAMLRDPACLELSRAFIPPGVVPGQVRKLENVPALVPEAIPEGAVVLLPFLLNHLVGANSPLPDVTPLIDWLQAVRARASATIGPAEE